MFGPLLRVSRLSCSTFLQHVRDQLLLVNIFLMVRAALIAFRIWSVSRRANAKNANRSETRTPLENALRIIVVSVSLRIVIDHRSLHVLHRNRDCRFNGFFFERLALNSMRVGYTPLQFAFCSSRPWSSTTQFILYPTAYVFFFLGPSRALFKL